MYVINLHYTCPLDEVAQWLEPHRAFLDRHYASGEFIASGPKIPRSGGVILVKSISRQRLDEIIATDPFHQAGVAQYEVIAFSPVKHCEQFAALV